MHHVQGHYEESMVSSVLYKHGDFELEGATITFTDGQEYTLCKHFHEND